MATPAPTPAQEIDALLDAMDIPEDSGASPSLLEQGARFWNAGVEAVDRYGRGVQDVARLFTNHPVLGSAARGVDSAVRGAQLVAGIGRYSQRLMWARLRPSEVEALVNDDVPPGWTRQQAEQFMDYQETGQTRRLEAPGQPGGGNDWPALPAPPPPPPSWTRHTRQRVGPTVGPGGISGPVTFKPVRPTKPPPGQIGGARVWDNESARVPYQRPRLLPPENTDRRLVVSQGRPLEVYNEREEGRYTKKGRM